MALLIFASAFISKLAFVQPVVFLGGTFLGLTDSASSFYGMAFFAIAVIILFRMGFYEKHKVLKFSLSIVLLYGVEIFSVLKKGELMIKAFEPVFFLTAFLLMLYLAFQEKIMVYLKEPKQKLSLTAKGLSEVETAYVKALVGGKTIKELSVDKEVAESTVRNTLARAYKKLEVPDRAGLLALGEKYEIAD